METNEFGAGMRFHRTGKLREAEFHYRRALLLEPAQPEILYNLANVMTMNRSEHDITLVGQRARHEEALQLFARTMQALKNLLPATRTKIMRVSVPELAAFSLNAQGPLLRRMDRFYEAAEKFAEAHHLHPSAGFDLNLRAAFGKTVWEHHRGDRFHGICMSAAQFRSSIAQDEKATVLCRQRPPLPANPDDMDDDRGGGGGSADVSFEPARVLVLGDSHSRVFHYINHVTRSRHFDTCSVFGATAMGLSNNASFTQALPTFRAKLAEAEGGERDPRHE